MPKVWDRDASLTESFDTFWMKLFTKTANMGND